MNQPIREIELDAPGERLDAALSACYPELSRTRWQQLIDEGHVQLVGKGPVKASMRLAGGERVLVSFPEVVETELAAESIPLDIRYEDRDLLVVNKPAGMVVHPAPGHEQGTLVNAVLAHCPSLEGVGGERRPGIVHRLDKDTSGLIVIAKNERALRFLQEQFKRRTIEKYYLALVVGAIQPAEALIDAPIGRDPRQRKQMAVILPGSSAVSRPATTRYQALTYYERYTLVECRPLTGRTHQIRVHMAYAGFPIAGDTVYGRRKQPPGLQRHFLHAARLHLARPNGQMLELQAELPPELQTFLDGLDSSAA